MAKVNAVVVAAEEANLLCFDEIKKVPGAYQRVDDGRILIVYTEFPKLVEDERVRTKITRTGMAMLGRNGTLRKVNCDRNPDGKKQWKKFKGTITLNY